MTTTLALIALIAVACVVGILAVKQHLDRRPRLGRPDSRGRRALAQALDRLRVRRTAGRFQDRGNPDDRVSDLADESGWTRPDHLQLSPVGEQGQQTIRLGRPIDRTGAPLRDAFVFSQGSTPVGILGGFTGSGKTSALLSPACVMWGRDERGNLVGDGAPLLVASPKTELIEQALRSRQASGAPIAIWNVAGDALIPSELRPYLVSWTPLSEATTWNDARVTAMAMCAGAGEGAASGGFWERSAARLLAAGMYAVVLRGPGGTLEDVWDALTLPRLDDGAADGGKLPQTTPPIRALHRELTELANSPNVDTGDGRFAEREQRRIGARYAAKAIADCVSGADNTIGSMINTASTAVSAALIPGVADTPWDSPDALDVRRHLIHTPGTVAVVGSVLDMEAARPLLTAFFFATQRMIEREALARGGRIPRPLLWAIDELAIVMGDGMMFANLLATVRSQGVQVVWTTQELAALDAAYGASLRTRIVNNTVDRLLLRGVACRDTLQLVSDLLGEYLATIFSYSSASNKGHTSAEGGVSRQAGTGETHSWSQQYRPLAAIGRLTKLRKWEAVLVNGSDAAQLKLQPWFMDPVITSLVETGRPPAPEAQAGRQGVPVLRS